MTTERPLFIRLSLPPGLEESLEGLAKEVLREHPKNIYAFAAQYFENKLKERNKEQGFSPDHDLFVHDGVHKDGKASKEPSLAEDGTELESISGHVSMDEDEQGELDLPMDDPELESAATKIQAGFRGSKTRKQLQKEATDRKQKKPAEEGEDDDQTEIVDHSAKESGQGEDPAQRKAIDIQMPTSADDAPRDEEEPSDDEDLAQVDIVGRPADLDKELDLAKPDEDESKDDPETTLAATKIQAGYRGMMVRRDLQDKRTLNKQSEVSESIGDDVESQTIVDIIAPEGDKPEEIDIDLDDPEVEAAATKIQAGFKGHVARKEMRKQREEDAEEPKDNEDQSATVIQAGFRGHQARQEYNQRKEFIEQRKEIPKSLDEFNRAIEDDIVDIDLNDPSVEKSATIIQAGYKGMRTRKELQSRKPKDEPEQQAPAEEATKADEKKEDEEIDIDLEDEDVGRAAEKIQAGFKGHQARKRVNEMKNEKELAKDNTDSVQKPDDKEEEVIDIDLEDEDVGKAAEKIQAGFKGHQARKKVKAMKEERETEQSKSDAQPEHDDEVIDIDLEDEEVGKAAEKIQAGFKGHQARKRVKEMKGNKEREEESQQPPEAEAAIDIDLEDEDVAQAAVKIQAGFKGHQARKKVEEMKQERQANVPEEGNEAADEEVIDIDLEDEDVAKAAEKIQAGFKGHQARKQVKELKKQKEGESEKEAQPDEAEEVIDIDLEDEEVGKAAEKIQAGFKGHQARKQVQEMKKQKEMQKADDAAEENEAEKEEIDIDLDDEDVGKAAEKIQAGFRGHQARQQVKIMKDEQENSKRADEESADPAASPSKADEQEEFDIDLEDEEVGKAAEKIQAGFKGNQARKRVQKIKEDAETAKEPAKEDANEVIDIDLEDEEVGKAAEKIQAGFKGHQARKQVKAMKEEKEAKDTETDSKQEPEEIIDIDLDDEEVGKAAEKIQAGFKGHQARKRVQAMKDEKATGDKTDQDQVDTTEAVDIDLEDEEVIKATEKIQAGFKGHQARQKVKEMKEERQANKVETEDKEEIIDIDLEDEEVGKAAEKIQAGFKGHQARKRVQQMKDEQADHRESVRAALELDLDDPQISDSATTIQAGFRGMQTRKKVEEMKETRMKEDHAATTIQAGFRGHQTRKSMSSRKTLEEDEDVEVMHRVADVGATPFQQSPRGGAGGGSHEEEDRDDPKKMKPKAETSTEGVVLGVTGQAQALDNATRIPEGGEVLALSLSSSTSSQVKEKDPGNASSSTLMVYHYRGSFSSQRVLWYLYERDIPFTAFHVDLQKNEHLSSWYLEINPRGEVPAVQLADRVVTDSTNILHHLEAQFSVERYPPRLVPDPMDATLYQKHTYFITILDQIALNELCYGLAYHGHEFGISRPDIDARVKQILSYRGTKLRQVAEDSETRGNSTAAGELRRKAAHFEKETLPSVTDQCNFRTIVIQSENTLDKLEEQLQQQGDGNAWLLGGSEFMALDIVLAVTLNKLALAGFHDHFWAKGKRPRLESFLDREGED